MMRAVSGTTSQRRKEAACWTSLCASVVARAGMHCAGSLAEAGTRSVRLPPRSPNLNCYAERFVRSIKEACLDRMILFGEDSLRTAVGEFTVHYHSERNHQGIGNLLIFPANRSRRTGSPLKPSRRNAQLL